MMTKLVEKNANGCEEPQKQEGNKQALLIFPNFLAKFQLILVHIKIVLFKKRSLSKKKRQLRAFSIVPFCDFDL